MALGDYLDKAKNLFLGKNDDDYEYDDYDYEDEEEYEAEPTPVAPVAPVSGASEFHPRKVGGQSTMTQRPTAMKVVVIEPKVFEDSENITHQLRDMRPVLINFENTDPHEAARIVDFVSGATYALDGKLEKVGKDIFMCVPVNISIDYSDNDNSKTEQNEYAWDNK